MRVREAGGALGFGRDCLLGMGHGGDEGKEGLGGKFFADDADFLLDFTGVWG